MNTKGFLNNFYNNYKPCSIYDNPYSTNYPYDKRPVFRTNECIEENGIVYKGYSSNGALYINHIDIKDNNLKSFSFCVPNNNKIFKFNSVEFCIENKKSFPFIKELHIGKNVKNISVPNKMFPNVELIKSDNYLFDDNRDILVHKNVLINTFHKNHDYVLNLSGIENIKDLALEGCATKKVINTASIKHYEKKAFDNYESYKDKNTGAKIFGDILIDLNYDSEIVEIPDDKYTLRILNKLDFKEHNKAILIHKYYTLMDLVDCELPKKLIIDIKDKDETAFWSFPSLIYDVKKLEKKIENIEVKNSEYYKTIDGILYSSDMKNLIFCSRLKTGKVRVPEGVENICENAFSNSLIEEITISESLTMIEKKAFYSCLNLKKVHLNKNIKSLGTKCFEGCKNLETIIIPKSIRVIPKNCFSGCELKTIELNEGLYKIEEGAFNSACCKELKIPESLLSIEPFNFYNVPVFYVKNKLPHGLIYNATRKANKDNVYTSTIYCNDEVICLPKIINRQYTINIISAIEKQSLTVIKNASYLLMNEISDGTIFNFTALEIYEKTQNEKMKNLLKESVPSFLKQIINTKDDKTLIRLLKTGVIKYSYMKKLLNETEKCNMTISTAYILDFMRRYVVVNNNNFKL